MAVIFAVVGVGAVIGIAEDYSNHSDYSDYSDYSNHSDYSDAAIRQAMRVQAQQSSIRSAAVDLHDYKEESVNPKLKSRRLKDTPAMQVDEDDMDRDAKARIQQEENSQINRATAEERERIAEIDRLFQRIDEIQRES